MVNVSNFNFNSDRHNIYDETLVYYYTSNPVNLIIYKK